jgi:hypothetical protein
MQRPPSSTSVGSSPTCGVRHGQSSPGCAGGTPTACSAMAFDASPGRSARWRSCARRVLRPAPDVTGGALDGLHTSGVRAYGHLNPAADASTGGSGRHCRSTHAGGDHRREATGSVTGPSAHGPRPGAGRAPCRRGGLPRRPALGASGEPLADPVMGADNAGLTDRTSEATNCADGDTEESEGARTGQRTRRCIRETSEVEERSRRRWSPHVGNPAQTRQVPPPQGPGPRPGPFP